MNEILINIISVLVTAVIIPLISIGGTQLSATRAVFQTYVESLKAEGKFDAHSQVVALERAKDIALNQMKDDVKEYIVANYGNLDSWLTTQIEATINLLKNK